MNIQIDINASSVKKAVCIGENIRNVDFSLNLLGKKIADKWNIQLFSTYASTEMQTAFTECKAGQGGHHHPELLIVELLDEQDKPVPPGTPGEVTITTLGVEAMPLLRYKTGDICQYYEEPLFLRPPDPTLIPGHRPPQTNDQIQRHYAVPARAVRPAERYGRGEGVCGGSVLQRDRHG